MEDRGVMAEEEDMEVGVAEGDRGVTAEAEVAAAEETTADEDIELEYSSEAALPLRVCCLQQKEVPRLFSRDFFYKDVYDLTYTQL